MPLIADLEAALHARGAEPARDRYVDPIALGALIVSVAQLAWTVYSDRRRHGPEPASEVLARAVRVELQQSTSVTTEIRDRVIVVVVEETIAAGKREAPPATSA
jgi:hypothetical protein